jgi:hypothetical protein
MHFHHSTSLTTILLLACLCCTVLGHGEQRYSFQSITNRYESIYYGLVDSELSLARSAPSMVRSPVTAPPTKAEAERRRDARDGISSMPVAGYIPWGRSHTNTTGSPQNLYTSLNDHAYRTVAYHVNEVLGGVLLNGSRYLINDINYNDGADCTLMQLVYQWMVDVDGAMFLFAPTSPDCSVLAKFAESRELLFGNAADASLIILGEIGGSTPYDNVPPGSSYAAGISYSKLDWTYNTQNNLALYYHSCGTTMTDPLYIDQSGVAIGDPPAHVRTFALASNSAQVPYISDEMRAVLLGFNVTEVYPEQNLILDDILTQQCTYLDETFTGWQQAKPDFAYLIDGASNGSLGMSCMHQLRYNPPLLMIPTDVDPSFDAWHTAGTIRESPFFASEDFPDPVMGSLSTFISEYEALWNVTPTFYEFSIASTAIVLIDCINMTQTLDKYIVRECIRAYNKTTMYGQLSFVTSLHYLPRPNVCIQRHDNYTETVVFPLDYPGRVPLIFPYPFQFNQTWLSLFDSPKTLSSTNLALIITFSLLGAIILGVVITLVVVKLKYHTIFITKSMTNNEWGNGDM